MRHTPFDWASLLRDGGMRRPGRGRRGTARIAARWGGPGQSSRSDRTGGPWSARRDRVSIATDQAHGGQILPGSPRPDCRARLGRIAGHYHVADDVAQEVCIAVLSALPRYRDMGRPFASFVFGIASHKVADAMRTASKLAVPTEDLPDGPDDRPGPEETRSE